MRKYHNQIRNISVPFTVSETALDRNGKWIVRKSAQYFIRVLQYKPCINREMFEFLLSVIGPHEMELYHKFTRHKNGDNLKTFTRKRVNAEDLDDISRAYSIYFSSIKKNLQYLFIKDIIATLQDRYSSLKFNGLSDIEKYLNSITKMFCLNKDEKTMLNLLFLLTI